MLTRRDGISSQRLCRVPASAFAEEYPLRPVRVIVPQAPGSTVDIAARLVSNELSKRMNQQFFVENRPGAGQNIGTEIALKAPPDGYTLLFATAANASNAGLYKNLPFSFVDDATPVGGVMLIPNVMIVAPAFPVQTIPEFIAYAKRHPDAINMASSGNGTTPHLAGELFKTAADVRMTHVPYRGSAPALTDLAAGHVDVMFEVLGAAMGLIREGKVRALGVTTKSRSAALKEIPSISEFLPGYDVSSWNGLVGPAGLPKSIIGTLENQLALILNDPRIKERFETFGAAPMPLKSSEFAPFIRAETAKWTELIRAADIRPD